MTDDDLLHAVARASREAEAPDDVLDDPRWDELAAGTLSPEGVAELHAWAERDPRARQALTMFEPLSDAVAERMADAALGAVDGDAPRAAPVPDGGASGRDAPPVAQLPVALPEPAEPPARVIPFARRGVRVAWAAGAALAAAAAVVLVLRGGAGAPLPGYELAFVGGDRAERSAPDPTEQPRLSPASRVDVVLRPATATASGVDVRVLALAGATAKVVPAPFADAGQGVMRLLGPTRTVLPGLPAGEVELVFLIGKKGALPDDVEALRRLAASPPADVRALRRQVTVLPPGG